MTQFGSGPPTVVCYICGREFGRSSIAIHEPQCAKKFEAAEALKPPNERRPLPKKPQVAAGATREEWNKAASEAYEAKVMAHCPQCGRSFKDDATMQRHLKSCNGKGVGGAAGPGGASGGGGFKLPPEVEAKIAAEGGGGGGGAGGAGDTFKKPRTVVCYICGREFGTSSIAIHEPQCLKKFETAEAQKPAHERKPLPRRPEVGQGATREEYNAAAGQAYEAKVMAHCGGCGRTFKDEATLARHAKSCKGGGPGPGADVAEAKVRAFEKQIKGEAGGGGGGGGEGKKPIAPRTVVCYICGREFGTASIGIHEPQCAKKFLEAESQKPKHERKPLPQRPEVQEGIAREQYNEAAKEAYEAKVMAHCPSCGRTFKDEATLARHAKACQGGGAGPSVDPVAEAKMKAFKDQMAGGGCQPCDSGGRGQGGAGAGGPAPRVPKTVVCYICGREFGRSSIAIHEPQCAKKWEETEAQKPAAERKPLPRRPEVAEGASYEEYNQAAKGTHEAEAMAHCAGCGRTFKDEQTLARHMKACKGDSAGAARQPSPSPERSRPPSCPPAGAGGGGGPGGQTGSKGPRTVVCYICGREFGRSSVAIHEPQCAKKFLAAEEKKPAHERRPLPQRPELAEGATREQWNEAALEAYEDKVMAHCDLCGRSFKDEETLRRHQKACKGPRGSPSPGPGGEAAQAAPEAAARRRPSEAAHQPAGDGGRPTGPKTVVCYICGREFGSSSIGIHEKQCAKKFEDMETAKPPEQRRPLPERPQVREGASREEHNAAAAAAYEAQVMVSCPACGRTFKDEATLARHAKACGAAAAGDDLGAARPHGRGSRPRSGVLRGAGQLAMG